MKTLGTALPAEQKRCRELLCQYEKIGSAGMFGAIIIRQKLDKADKAVISCDPVAMLSAYEELKKLE